MTWHDAQEIVIPAKRLVVPEKRFSVPDKVLVPPARVLVPDREVIARPQNVIFNEDKFSASTRYVSMRASLYMCLVHAPLRHRHRGRHDMTRLPLHPPWVTQDRTSDGCMHALDTDG